VVASNGTMFIPNFIKLGQLKEVTDTDLITYFFFRKESRQKFFLGISTPSHTSKLNPGRDAM
jgi:hypothetical protein